MRQPDHAGAHHGASRRFAPTVVDADVDVSRSAIVADDSEAVRKVIGALLRRGGFEVREAADGAEAWAMIAERPPHVLVVDDVLPCISGVELVHTLRARTHDQPVRVAFLTEYQSGYDRAALVGLGADSVIRKPFDIEVVAAQLRVICP